MGFAVRNDLINHRDSLPVGICDRLMSLHILIGRDRHITFLSCYAPTLKLSVEIKDAFYASLCSQ